MPYAQNGEIKIYYESHGQGEALVFGHGFTLDHRLWIPQVEELSKKYQVVTLDFRGHGRSGAPETGYSRDHRITDYLAVVDELKLERFHLIGLSMGGMTAIGLALDYPERLKSLVLVSASVTRYNPARQLDTITKLAREKGVEVAREKWLQSIMRYFETKPAGQKELVRTMILEHSCKPWMDPNRGAYDNRDDLALLSQRKEFPPTLILVGELDLKFHKVGRLMHEAINGSVLEFVPQVGHLMNIEKPDWFNKRISDWVESVAA